ncbi:MAG TPA: CAP domain-containing protein [Acidimicrobiales bacterium]
MAVRLGIEEDDAGSTTVPSSATTSSTTSTTSTTAPPTTPPTTTPPTTAPPSSSPPTTEAPAPPPAPSATDWVVALVNAARADAGCDPLRIDSRLTAAAQGHSDDMAEQDYFSHTSLDGRTFADRVRAAGYPRPGGENIAQGQRTPEEVHEAWMNSEGHRANILNCNFTAIGVGLNSSERIWTQNFGY